MKPGPGSLLIAPPTMTDPRFSKTVLLVTHNNNAGAFALCLNKPTKHTAKNLSTELELDKELPFQMFWGGPVNHGTIWMIHENTWSCEHTMYVNEKWNVTSHESMFYHMADGDAPKNLRLCFGFCSWMPGQLDMELLGESPFSKKSSWVYAENADPEWMFETPVDELWEDATNLAAGKAIESWM
jgi:putative transcriptional regulator